MVGIKHLAIWICPENMIMYKPASKQKNCTFEYCVLCVSHGTAHYKDMMIL